MSETFNAEDLVQLGSLKYVTDHIKDEIKNNVDDSALRGVSFTNDKLNFFNSTDTSTQPVTQIDFPVAGANKLGGVKVGNNISIDSSGALSVTKTNIVDALGYTPPSGASSYSEVTEERPGLMSTRDKINFDYLMHNSIVYWKTDSANTSLMSAAGDVVAVIPGVASFPKNYPTLTTESFSDGFVMGGSHYAQDYFESYKEAPNKYDTIIEVYSDLYNYSMANILGVPPEENELADKCGIYAFAYSLKKIPDAVINDYLQTDYPPTALLTVSQTLNNITGPKCAILYFFEGITTSSLSKKFINIDKANYFTESDKTNAMSANGYYAYYANSGAFQVVLPLVEDSGYYKAIVPGELIKAMCEPISYNNDNALKFAVFGMYRPS